LKSLGVAPRWQRANEGKNGVEQSLLSAVQRLRRVASPGSLIFILSDFAGLTRTTASQITELGRHSEVVLGFCHDPLEAELPPAGHYRVSDGAQRRVIATGSQVQREEYHARFESQLGELARLAHLPGIHLLPLSTADDPLAVLPRRFGVKRCGSL